MSDTIKVEFLADPKQIEAAAARASAAMGGFATKSEAAAARVKKSFSISGVEKIQSEIAALNMQRSGYENLANSMRESFRLKEQAVALANKENITIEQALTLLRQKSLLEKNIAAAAQQAATQATAAQQKQIDLAKQKETLLARERAAYEAQSNAILGSTAAARKAEAARAARIANPRQIGLPEMALTPQSLSRIERAAFLQQNLARQTYLAGSSGKAGALGFLAFSQAVEDAQFGVRGILNNIPQMVLGFGGGAGLAGVFSLAAVGAYAAYQAFQKLSGIKEMKEWAANSAKATDAFTDSLNKSRLAATALSAEIESMNRLNAEREKAGFEIDRSVVADPRILNNDAAFEQQRARSRANQNQLLQAANSVSPTDPTAQQQGQLETQRAAVEYALEQQRLAEDLVTQQQRLTAAGGEYERIWQNMGTLLSKYQSQKNQLVSEEIEIKKNLSAREAEAVRQQIEYDTRKYELGKKVLKIRLDDKLAEVAAIKATLDIKKKEIEAANDNIAKVREEGNTSKQALDDRVARLKLDIAATTDAIKAGENLARVDADIIKLRALQTRDGELDDTLKTAEQVQKKTREIAAPLEENAKRQTDTLRVGSTRAAEFAEWREQTRLAEKDAKGSGFEPKALEDERQRQKDLQKLMDENTGSLRERGDRRRAQIAAEREAKRDDKRREAAVKRENEKRDRAGLDHIDEPTAAAREANQKAEAERQKAADAREKNAENQLKTQQSIESLLKKIEPKLPTAVLAN